MITPVKSWPDDLCRDLRESFFLRTTFARKDGSLRTLETTFGWNGEREIVLSGFPGKRDWVASLVHKPEVVVHTVEREPGWDIAGRARVLRDRDERLPHLFAFVERWSLRPGFPRRRFAFLLGAVRMNRRVGLPWWGPFYLARRIFDAMPCVVIELTGEPIRRVDPAPPATPARSARSDQHP
jgi:hypothetical protein